MNRKEFPITMGFDQKPVGRIEFQDEVAGLLSHPDLWDLAIGHTNRDGVLSITEVSIVPITGPGRSEETMSKTVLFYVCPACSRSTNDATVTLDYTPNATDCKLRPNVPKAREGERLTCPCGQVYTWFSAREVTFRDRT